MSFIPKNYVKGYAVDNTNDGAPDPAFLLIGQDTASKMRFFSDKDFPEEIVMYVDIDYTLCDSSSATFSSPFNQQSIFLYDFVAKHKNMYFFKSIIVSVAEEKKSIFENKKEGFMGNNSDYVIQKDCVLTNNFDCVLTGKVNHLDLIPMGAGYHTIDFNTIIHAQQSTAVFSHNKATQNFDCKFEKSGLSINDMINAMMLQLIVHFKDNTRLYQSKSIQIVGGNFCVIFGKKKGVIVQN